jgi:D-arabinose 1-dehydrogenase-like Zn-dependent alcohol dehydrogenase
MTVLAPAIGGSVGNAVTQLATALGAAKAISTSTSPAKVRRARDLGFSDVIDLSVENVVDGMRRITGAQKFGYQVAAIGRGPENTALAKKLGASVYIDSAGANAAAELQKLGGARVILATAPSSKAMSSLVDGLGMNGKMMVVGATTDPIEMTPIQLIFGMRSIQGWASGIPTDSEDTLRFAELTGARPMIEQYPLAKAGKAYARMMSAGRRSFASSLRCKCSQRAHKDAAYETLPHGAGQHRPTDVDSPMPSRGARMEASDRTEGGAS